jgi:plastocyanin domain-containing protein
MFKAAFSISGLLILGLIGLLLAWYKLRKQKSD